MNTEPYKKIIIIQTAFIGDLILTTPLIRTIRSHFPESQIDIVVIPQTVNILANNPHLNHIILFDKRKNKWSAFFETLKVLKKEHYDLAILPHRSLTSGLLMLFANIKKRIGFTGRISSSFLTDQIPRIDGILTIQKYLMLADVIPEIRTNDIQTELFWDEKTEAKSKKLVQITKNQHAIAIAPGSVWFTKRLPEEYFVQLVKKLAGDKHLLVFIGSQDERDLCQRIIDNGQTGSAINLAGKTSLLESAAVIKRCDLMICNDSGALHIANAVKTDVIAFFGPTVKNFGFFPFRENDTVFEIDLDCRPCGSHGGKSCPLKHFKCMRDIDIELVYEAVRTKLSAKIGS